ncbi:DUF1048 domain-containing protein [Lapidilactobacillus bayanensis]|uniref:DUF1048 domain-containing protein n=1 Tax=Lapidilactobacillus bayanensis TaxID=2485998 RepID=UPI000F776A17|nr:DUF1048 domain-containing protein [Lapidilactobacillus bayanensis]
MEFWKKLVGDKKWYRDYKKQEQALPEPYRTAIQTLDNYLMQYWGTDEFVDLFDNLLTLFQEGSAEGVSIEGIVGTDPVVFADELLAQYQQATWMHKQQEKLRKAFKELN